MIVNELVKVIARNQFIEISGQTNFSSPEFNGIAEEFIHSKNFETLAKRTVRGVLSTIDANGDDCILIYYDDWKKD